MLTALSQSKLSECQCLIIISNISCTSPVNSSGIIIIHKNLISSFPNFNHKQPSIQFVLFFTIFFISVHCAERPANSRITYFIVSSAEQSAQNLKQLMLLVYTFFFHRIAMETIINFKQVIKIPNGKQLHCQHLY